MASDALAPTPNRVLRYLAALSAGRDFGASRDDLAAIARRFDPLRTSTDDLAGALADLILARARP